MRELISLQAIGLSPIEAVRYYLALKMAERGLVSAPNAAAGVPFNIGGQPTGFYPLGPETGLPTQIPNPPPADVPPQLPPFGGPPQGYNPYEQGGNPTGEQQ